MPRLVHDFGLRHMHWSTDHTFCQNVDDMQRSTVKMGIWDGLHNAQDYKPSIHEKSCFGVKGSFTMSI